MNALRSSVCTALAVTLTCLSAPAQGPDEFRDRQPGVTMGEINAVVNDILMEGLMDVGLIESKDRASLRQYYWHGLAHSLGLNVHDVGGLGTLEAGMVLTIEPGLYIREEAIGFRIEDDILVTENGHEILTASAPKTVEAIEAMMAEPGIDFSRYLIIRDR